MHIHKVIPQKLVAAALGAMILSSPGAFASLSINYEGLDQVSETKQEDYHHRESAPEGFRQLASNRYGVVYQVGIPADVELLRQTGEVPALPLPDAMSLLMPDQWISYLDEEGDISRTVSWSAKDNTWIDVLDQVGHSHGFAFIVDWEQKLIQVMTGGSDRGSIPSSTAVLDVSNDEDQIQVRGHANSRPTDLSKGVVVKGGKTFSVRLAEDS